MQQVDQGKKLVLNKLRRKKAIATVNDITHNSRYHNAPCEGLPQVENHSSDDQIGTTKNQPLQNDGKAKVWIERQFTYLLLLITHKLISTNGGSAKA